MNSINEKISAAYGITPYGKTGMEIARDGTPVKFTKRATKFENWMDAVKWARKNTPAKDGKQ